MTWTPDRRQILAAAGASLLAPASRARASAASATDPFSLGVASGSPSADGMVLWTRLAPQPLAPGGLGGLTDWAPVGWELSADEGLRQVVRRGSAVAHPRFAHSVHVELAGLPPGRPYWYRFTALGHRSPVGRTATLPAPGAETAALKFVVASCSNYEAGWFAAYRHMAEERPDLTFFVGDYIYEASYGPERADQAVRRHEQLPEIRTLGEYRRRYAHYRTDPDLQALHAAAPCIATWDDHEVENDYANRWSEHPEVDPAQFLKRRAAAYRAFWEHMPMRRSALPVGPDARIYGASAYGSLADILVLDGRQYRTPQPCPTPAWHGGHVATCPELADPSRTMLGFAQERWLAERFRKGGGRWTLVVQDLLIASLQQAGPDGAFGHYTDGWDGYQATRSRMLAGLARSGARNPVFFGGDIHSFWATDLKADYADPGSATVGTEFVGTSVTSDSPRPALFEGVRQRDPHVRFADGRTHGYIAVELARTRMLTRFQAISDRRDPQAGVATLQAFTVEDGRPGAQFA